jgi:glyoxylase-like metal-dependent hydrolase (beta-lactamase superfamily II)
VPPPRSLDLLVQLDRPGKGALGYLLISDGDALVVDPPRDATRYLDVVRTAAANVTGVADTHLHADYVSGGPALARALGVPYYLHPADALSPYDGTPGRLTFHPIRDGDVLRVGRCGVRVLHTPGHTEGSVCYVVDDQAVLTGDFIFVASLGRPDLAGRTAEWAADLWRSVEMSRRAWPAATIVYPAHYASNAERRQDGVVAASFGTLLTESEPLRFEAEAAFLDWVTARSGAFPDAYRHIKHINLGLEDADDAAIDVLEAGLNRCALRS